MNNTRVSHKKKVTNGLIFILSPDPNASLRNKPKIDTRKRLKENIVT